MNNIIITDKYLLDEKIYSHSEMTDLLAQDKLTVWHKYPEKLNTVEYERLKAKAIEMGFKDCNLIFNPFPNINVRLEEKNNPAKHHTLSLAEFGYRKQN